MLDILRIIWASETTHVAQHFDQFKFHIYYMQNMVERHINQQVKASDLVQEKNKHSPGPNVCHFGRRPKLPFKIPTKINQRNKTIQVFRHQIHFINSDMKILIFSFLKIRPMHELAFRPRQIIRLFLILFFIFTVQKEDGAQSVQIFFLKSSSLYISSRFVT